MATPAKRRGVLSPPSATSPSSTHHEAIAASSLSSYFLPDMIPLVASRLTSLQDFFALRAVCRTYRALLPLTPSNLASQAPHLLLLSEAAGSHTLFCLPLRRLLRFRLPGIRLDPYKSDITRFYSLGCRVAIEDRVYRPSRRELRIVHLLTGETSRFPQLPKHFYRVLRSNELVLACNPYDSIIQYYRLGDDRWSVASSGEIRRFGDLIFVKDTLYALVNPGFHLALVNLLRPSPFRNTSHSSTLSDSNFMELGFVGSELDEQIVQKSSLFFLAECRGELLLVSSVQLYPREYHVYRWQIEERNWVRTTNIGGCTLFFHDHSFVSSIGPDHPGIGRGCLYFTSEVCGKWSEYSLVDGSFHEFNDSAVREAADKASLFWVFPSMCRCARCVVQKFLSKVHGDISVVSRLRSASSW